MRLKELREARGFTQMGLSEKAGVAQSFINDIEAGTKSPTLRTLQKLADALEVEVTDLISTPKNGRRQQHETASTQRTRTSA